MEKQKLLFNAALTIYKSNQRLILDVSRTASGSFIQKKSFFFKSRLPEYEQGPRKMTWGSDSFLYKQFENNLFWRPRNGLKIKYIIFMQQKYDFSPPSIRRWLEKKLLEQNIREQCFIPERQAHVGANIAAAYMMLYLGGSIRFSGQIEWISKKKGHYELPVSFVPNLYLEGVNMEGTEILYEGLENLSNCKNLKWLSLHNCSHIDDWCLDRISSETYRTSLQYLDLSNCNLITERGLAILCRFRSLKKLVLSNFPKAKHLELMCILLEEALPNCTIEGVDYLKTRDVKDSNTDSLPELQPVENLLTLSDAKQTASVRS